MDGRRPGSTWLSQLFEKSMQTTQQSRYWSLLWYVNFTVQFLKMLIPIIVQTESSLDSCDITNFMDIPMDNIDDWCELDDFLSQPLKKVQDPILWWWEHHVMFPTLLTMALDYLSIPGALFLL